MILDTSRFGRLDIEQADIIRFEHGLPGFEENKQFVILELEESPFAYLQSVDQGELAFIITDPFFFFPSYEFSIPESAKDELKLTREDQVMTRSIVTVRDSLENATLNLVAPLIINCELKIAKQVILSNTSHTTRHAIFNQSNIKGGD